MLDAVRPYWFAAMMVPSALSSMIASFSVFWFARDHYGSAPDQTTGLTYFVVLLSVLFGVHAGVWFKLLGLKVAQREGRLVIVSKEIGRTRPVVAVTGGVLFTAVALWLLWASSMCLTEPPQAAAAEERSPLNPGETFRPRRLSGSRSATRRSRAVSTKAFAPPVLL